MLLSPSMVCNINGNNSFVMHIFLFDGWHSAESSSRDTDSAN